MSLGRTHYPSVYPPTDDLYPSAFNKLVLAPLRPQIVCVVDSSAVKLPVGVLVSLQPTARILLLG